MPKTYSKGWDRSMTTWLLSDSNPTQYWTPVGVRTYRDKSRSFQNFVSTNNYLARPWSNYLYQINSGWGGRIEEHEIGVQPVYVSQWYVYANVFYRGMNVSKGEYTDFAWQGTPPELESCRTIAKAKLAASLKEERTQWQAAVALGEGRETMRMIAGMATRLFKGFTAFKRGNLGDAYRALSGRGRPLTRDERAYRNLNRRRKDPETWKRDVASNWMEFSFGWKPLLGDIDSAARYLAERHVGKKYRVYGVTRAHKTEVVSKTEVVNAWPDNQRFSLIKLLEVKLRLIYELDPDWLRQPSTVAELGFTDPYSVAWELLPLSCFADYILNVGQVLESLYEFKQWTVRRGLESYKFSRTWDKSMTSNGVMSRPAASGFNHYAIGPHGRWSWRKYAPQGLLQRECGRLLLSTLPPSVPLRIKVDNPFDLKAGQWANIVGLGYLAFTGAPRIPELGEGAIHRVRTSFRR